MGKYLDKTGLQYFYNKLKEKFADKTTIDAKLESLTGALTWKGKKDTLPTDLTDYSAGNVIAVGTKEYVCTEVNGVKSWDELGDEGSYLLKTTAEETYLKIADGEVKTANLADGSVNSDKLAKGERNADNFYFDETIGIDKKAYTVFEYMAFSGTQDSFKTDFRLVDAASGGIWNITRIMPGLYALIEGEPYDAMDITAVSNNTAYPKELTLRIIKKNLDEDKIGFKNRYMIQYNINDILFYSKNIANSAITAEKIQDNSVTKAKLSTDVQTSLGKADNSVQLYACNPAKTHYPTVFLDDDCYGCLEVRDASDTDVMMASKPYVSIRKNAVDVRGKEGDRMSRNVIVDADGMKIGGQDMGNHFIGIGENNKLKIGGTSSTSKETLGGVATPVEDTDAANKAYVDRKTANTVQTTTQSLTEEQKNIVRSNIGAESCLYIDLSDPEIADVWDDTFTQGDFCIRTENAISDTYKDKRLRVLSFIKSKLPLESDGEGNSYYTQFYNPNFYVYLLMHEDGISLPILCDILGHDVDSIYCCTFPPLYSCRTFVDEDHFVRSANDLYYYMPFNTAGSGPNAGVVAYGYYNMNTGDVFYAQTAGELIFRTLKPLYLTSDYGDAFTYTDEDKATGREILNVPDKTSLATSLQAVTIYTDNTTEHKAQNLANIKAYEDNLKAMGVDVTTGYTMPIVCSPSSYCGVLFSKGNGYFDGHANVHNTTHGLGIKVTPTGEFTSTDVVDTATSFNTLTTTSKQIIPAINEVNDEIGYKQDKYDDSLATNNKTIVEAINENTDDIGVLSGSMANCIKTNEDAVLNGVLINDDINFKVTGKESSFISIRTTGVDGELEFGSDVDQVTLKNISAPDDELDAANKAYVDSKVSDIYKPIYVDRNLIDLDVNSTVTPLAWDAIKSAIGKGLIINGTMDSTSEETIAANKYNYGINANVNAKYLKVESTIGGTPSLRLASVAVSFMDEDDTYRKITFDSSGKITAKATKNIFDSTTVANQLAQI